MLILTLGCILRKPKVSPVKDTTKIIYMVLLRLNETVARIWNGKYIIIAFIINLVLIQMIKLECYLQTMPFQKPSKQTK